MKKRVVFMSLLLVACSSQNSAPHDLSDLNSVTEPSVEMPRLFPYIKDGISAQGEYSKCNPGGYYKNTGSGFRMYSNYADPKVATANYMAIDLEVPALKDIHINRDGLPNAKGEKEYPALYWYTGGEGAGTYGKPLDLAVVYNKNSDVGGKSFLHIYAQTRKKIDDKEKTLILNTRTKDEKGEYMYYYRIPMSKNNRTPVRMVMFIKGKKVKFKVSSDKLEKVHKKTGKVVKDQKTVTFTWPKENGKDGWISNEWHDTKNWGWTSKLTKESKQPLKVVQTIAYNNVKNSSFFKKRSARVNGTVWNSIKVATVQKWGKNGVPIKKQIHKKWHDPSKENAYCVQGHKDTKYKDDGSMVTNIALNAKKHGATSIVLDDTGSMASSIAGVQHAAADVIRNTNVPAQWSLFTFKDSVDFRGETADKSKILSMLSGVGAGGGGDCPENSVGALRSSVNWLSSFKATEFSRNIVFATDASSKGGDYRSVINSAKRNKIKVNVLLTGRGCDDESLMGENPNYSDNLANNSSNDEQIPEDMKMYKEIAEETGGIFSYSPDGTAAEYSEIFKEMFKKSLDSAPELKISVSPSVIWPPANRYFEITPTISVKDDHDPNPKVELVGVTSNQPEKKSISIKQGYIFVRGKRFVNVANAGPRIYTITYKATDSAGNSTTASATVTVPLNKPRN